MRIAKLTALAVIAVCSLRGGPAAAQGGGVVQFSKEAMDDLTHLLSKGLKDGYKMDINGTNFFGGWLQRGYGQGNEPWITILTLLDADPGRTYRIIASGDNDTIDLDLRIVDPDGRVIALDDTVLRDAEVTFRPGRRQNYRIQLRLYNSRHPCVCIGAILTK